jgi:hypothetical protein
MLVDTDQTVSGCPLIAGMIASMRRLDQRVHIDTAGARFEAFIAQTVRLAGSKRLNRGLPAKLATCSVSQIIAVQKSNVVNSHVAVVAATIIGRRPEL